MKIFSIAALSLILLASPVWAQTAPAADAASELLSANSADQEATPPPAQPASDLFFPPEAPAPRFGIDLLWAVGMFILVLTLLFITLKVLGRFSRFRGGRGKSQIFTMRGIMPLDSRKYLAAVEVKGQLLIVGVTPERVTPVAHWPLDSDADDDFTFQFENDTELPHITDPLSGGAK